MTDVATCPHQNLTFQFRYSPDFHDKFTVSKCDGCGAHFLDCSFETVDWEKGNDRAWNQSSRVPMSPEELERHRAAHATFGDE